MSMRGRAASGVRSRISVSRSALRFRSYGYGFGVPGFRKGFSVVGELLTSRELCVEFSPRYLRLSTPSETPHVDSCT